MFPLSFLASNTVKFSIFLTFCYFSLSVPLRVSLVAVAVSLFMNGLWLLVCLALSYKCCCKEREKDQPFYIIMAVIIGMDFSIKLLCTQNILDSGVSKKA